jgi:CheY-like chemotaxis protein
VTRVQARTPWRSESPDRPDAIGSVRVLFMDDQAVVRQVADRALRRAGYEPCLVASGEEAIAAYREAMEHGRRFDAVVLDLTVPSGLGGREAAAELLTIDSSAKIIVSSGYSEDGVMSDYKRYGFLAVLPKPYNASQLVDSIARLLR